MLDDAECEAEEELTRALEEECEADADAELLHVLVSRTSWSPCFSVWSGLSLRRCRPVSEVQRLLVEGWAPGLSALYWCSHLLLRAQSLAGRGTGYCGARRRAAR